MNNATETKTETKTVKILWSNGATTMSAARLILGVQFGFDISGLSWDMETILAHKNGDKKAIVTPKKDAHGTYYAVLVVSA